MKMLHKRFKKKKERNPPVDSARPVEWTQGGGGVKSSLRLVSAGEWKRKRGSRGGGQYIPYCLAIRRKEKVLK